MYRSRLLLAFFLVLTGGGFCVASEGHTLSRSEAVSLMKSNGFRWKQTDELAPQADGVLTQAEAAGKPRIQLVSREFIGRVNQIEYGFDTPGSLTWFTIGQTSVQGLYSIIDKSADDRIEAAKHNVQINRYDTKYYQNELIYLLLLSYANAQRIETKLDKIRLTTERDQQILKLATAKVKSGAGISLDMTRAQGLIAVDRLKTLELQTAYVKTCNDIRTLIGKDDYEISVPLLDFKQFNPKTESEALKKAKSERFDILAAQETAIAASALKLQAADDFKPKVTVFGEIGAVGTHVIGGVGNAATGTLGVQLTLMLYDGQLTSGREQEASTKVSQAVLQEKELELEADAQVKTALVQLEQSKKTIEVTRSQIEIAETEIKLSKQRFTAGLVSGLEMTTAQGNLAAALDVNVDAIFGYEVAKINYFRAVGSYDAYFLEE